MPTLFSDAETKQIKTAHGIAQKKLDGLAKVIAEEKGYHTLMFQKTLVTELEEVRESLLKASQEYVLEKEKKGEKVSEDVVNKSTRFLTDLNLLIDTLTLLNSSVDPKKPGKQPPSADSLMDKLDKVTASFDTLYEAAPTRTLGEAFTKLLNVISNYITKLCTQVKEHSAGFFAKGESDKPEGEIDHEHDKDQEKGSPQNQ
ncbi:MAG: hypothetical protein P1U32_09445 [Legionellaceae bacterium]|nr:hypothetical protein [Legionellaceae bacterium]